MPFNSFDDYYMSWRPSLSGQTGPKYISLARQLEEDIVSGTLLPGTKLPPQRELADFLDINVSTVARAFKLCSDRGLITGTVGSGTYVAYDVRTNIFERPDGTGSRIINLGSLTPESVSPDEAVSVIERMFREPDTARLFQYDHTDKFFHKNAAVRLLDRAGCRTDESRILFSGGAQNAIAAIMAGLFTPGSHIGTTQLVYPGLKSAAKLFGIHLTPLKQDSEGNITEEGILYACKNDNIRALYIMPDFQNPTTHTMPYECRKMIADIAREKDLIVIEEGINCLLSDRPPEPVHNMAPDNTIYVSSLSKTVLPSLRLAYISAPEKYYDALDNALYNISLAPSAILMELASRLIVSGGLEAIVDDRREGLRRRNEVVDNILKGYDVRGNSSCINRWLILPGDISGSRFEQMALENGVYVYGSERFAVGKEPPENAARLSICVPDTLDELAEGLEILRSLL